MSTADMAWVAGVLEGEGWFVRSPNNRRKKPSRLTTVKVGVNMNDDDVIRSLQEKTGIGRVTVRQFKDGKRPQWVWCVDNRQDVVALLYRMLPYLHERRSVQALTLIDQAEGDFEYIEWLTAHFVCGHERTEENTYHFKYRNVAACKICNRERSRARYLKKTGVVV
jgi:hypothetical protein